MEQELKFSDFPDVKKDLEDFYKIIFTKISNSEEERLLNLDFSFFNRRGKFQIINLFAGGIIFLCEPEVIEKIRLNFPSRQERMIALVEYNSDKRNARNVKYKPKVGKIENASINMISVFPNFLNYQRPVKIKLIELIAKFVKKICEYHQQKSWIMKYERDFMLEVYLDKQKYMEIKVKKEK